MAATRNSIPTSSSRRYTLRMLDHHGTACLERSWNVFAMLLGLVRRLVNSPLFTRANRRRACRLLRMAEAFARRILVLRAQELAIEPQLNRPARSTPAASSEACPRNRSNPGLCLAEPLPDFVPLSDTPFPEPEPTDPVFLDPEEIPHPAPAARRLLVLEDILLRPAHHARRMAIWLRRFTEKTNRSNPFRLGLPPGASQKPKDPILDQRLRDADFFARRALRTAPG
ncbi:MAG: hypothetical protein RLN72_00780 [Henriciella sp.]